MKKYLRYVLIVLSVVILGILYSCERHEAGVTVIESEQMSSSSVRQNEEATTIAAEPVAETICIHVTGCVANPGVYQLTKGSRVYEAIVLAGGFREDADKDYLNQAAELSDGQKLHVYSIEEAATAGQYINSGVTQQEETKLVNINTATKEELMTLPGIGESRAESIIAYREENGGFRSIEDIMKVSGIKDAAFDKIKNYICTN